MAFSLLTGITISTVLSLLYVLTIYIKKAKSPDGEELDRNNTIVIQSRITRISAFTILTIAILPYLLAYLSNSPLTKIYSELGVLLGFIYQDDQLLFKYEQLIIGLKDIARSLVLVSILFVGPLTDYIFVKSNTPLEIFADFIDELSVIQGLRDLIIGPLTEEIIYTSSIIITLYQTPNISKNLLIFLPPVFFSFAHIHHAIELYFKNYPINIIILSTLFQMLYTFLFGIFTNFIFLRTGNTWACVAAHSFCNFMGVPSTSVSSKRFKYWNYTYYLLILLGIYGFSTSLYPFTESGLALVPW